MDKTKKMKIIKYSIGLFMTCLLITPVLLSETNEANTFVTLAQDAGNSYGYPYNGYGYDYVDDGNTNPDNGNDNTPTEETPTSTETSNTVSSGGSTGGGGGGGGGGSIPPASITPKTPEVKTTTPYKPKIPWTTKATTKETPEPTLTPLQTETPIKTREPNFLPGFEITNLAIGLAICLFLLKIKGEEK